MWFLGVGSFPGWPGIGGVLLLDLGVSSGIGEIFSSVMGGIWWHCSGLFFSRMELGILHPKGMETVFTAAYCSLEEWSGHLCLKELTLYTQQCSWTYALIALMAVCTSLVKAQVRPILTMDRKGGHEVLFLNKELLVRGSC